jgi:hypothetical protein
VAAWIERLVGSTDLVANMAHASTVAATVAADAAAAAVVVVVTARGETVEGSGLASAECPGVQMASLTLAESIDLVSAGMGPTWVEMLDSPIESGSSVGDLYHVRQILPDFDLQEEDCYSPSQADLVDQLDDSDGFQHTGPAETYLSTVVDGPDSLGLQDFCLPTAAAVA